MKKTFNSNLIIIGITIILFLVSAVFLSFTEQKQADLNTKNVWMIYFASAKDNSLDFAIENHSPSTTFHYQVLEDKDVVKQADVTVSTGKTLTIPVTLENTAGKKVSILLSTSDNIQKEIYKIF